MIIFFALSVLRCPAQSKLVPGEIKAAKDTFVVFKIPQFDSTRHIGIYSKSNKFKNGVPYSSEEKSKTFLPMNPKKEMHVDFNAIKQIIYSVLNKKMDALEKNKEQISLTCEFEPSGKMVDATFNLKKNTLINISEIEKIDHMLKASVPLRQIQP